MSNKYRKIPYYICIAILDQKSSSFKTCCSLSKVSHDVLTSATVAPKNIMHKLLKTREFGFLKRASLQFDIVVIILLDSAFDMAVACLVEFGIAPSFLFSLSTIVACSRAAQKLPGEFLLITFAHLLFC